MLKTERLKAGTAKYSNHAKALGQTSYDGWRNGVMERGLQPASTAVVRERAAVSMLVAVREVKRRERRAPSKLEMLGAGLKLPPFIFSSFYFCFLLSQFLLLNHPND